jgi:hypothetical protein
VIPGASVGHWIVRARRILLSLMPVAWSPTTAETIALGHLAVRITRFSDSA